MTDLPPPPYQPQGYGWTTGPTVADHATFGARFLAALLDGLLLGVPFAILGSIVEDEFRLTVNFGFNPSVPGWLNALSTLVGILYYSLLEGGPGGQTLGKRAVGIRVVDVDTGQPGIGIGRGVGRYFARILSGLPLLLGYFWMLWDPKKQTWHDKLVRTVVVRA